MYHVSVSLQNKEDFLVSPTVMPHSKNKHPKKNPKEASMHVWSFEGYSL